MTEDGAGLEGKYTKESVMNNGQKISGLQGAIQEAGRCLLCHDAPCNVGCGADTDPATFILKLRLGNIKGAVRTMRENNILAATCAEVCPTCRLCVEACSRTGIDEPIRISELQIFWRSTNARKTCRFCRLRTKGTGKSR